MFNVKRASPRISLEKRERERVLHLVSPPSPKLFLPKRSPEIPVLPRGGNHDRKAATEENDEYLHIDAMAARSIKTTCRSVKWKNDLPSFPSRGKIPEEEHDWMRLQRRFLPPWPSLTPIAARQMLLTIIATKEYWIRRKRILIKQLHYLLFDYFTVVSFNILKWKGVVIN